ncbi:uncharacterized protein LOC143502775 isoform X2 [Brachyhypopomus gauderio]|uniref:uncharacterized protein LOC143502775 isoform X2 n=1 Tax=Brachyhypopomus gauderio TaxID=698409 RepID=UPI00404393A3
MEERVRDLDTGSEAGDDALVGNVSKLTVTPPGHTGAPRKGHLTFDACFESGGCTALINACLSEPPLERVADGIRHARETRMPDARTCSPIPRGTEPPSGPRVLEAHAHSVQSAQGCSCWSHGKPAPWDEGGMKLYMSSTSRRRQYQLSSGVELNFPVV